MKELFDRVELTDGTEMTDKLLELNTSIAQRFIELEKDLTKITYPDGVDWHQWTTSVMHLLEQSLGEGSVHFRKFTEVQEFYLEDAQLDRAKGIFLSAKSAFEHGFLFSEVSMISREILGNFVGLAKAALEDGNKDVAAVLACAALEDALKRFARREGLTVDDKVMQNVVGALKEKGLVGGAQRDLLGVMPKIRDYAMHANWEKIKAEDVNSVIGFVEEFLAQRFSNPAQKRTIEE